VKKFASAFLSLLLASMLFVASAFAAEKQVEIRVGDEPIQFGSLEPVIVDGYTWAPKEPLFEALEIGEDFQFDYGQLINDTVYVPVRILAETIGYEIGWNGDTRTVTLEKAIVEGSRGFLWKIEHEGNTVYLLGSIHLAKADMYPLHPAIEAAFEEAAYLGTEIDISKAQSEEVQQLILEKAFYNDGTTLKDHISPETYARVNEKLVENGLPEGSLDSYKPWMVESVLMSLQALNFGYTEPGIDQYFTLKALEREMPILELESYEFQFDLFESFTPEFQEQSLLLSLEQYGDRKYIDALSEVWKSGSEEGILEIINEMKTYDEAYYNALLLDRNIGMADKVESYLNDPDGEVFFIIAGSAHMPGEDGVVQLLQDRGYTVEKVQY
jgi:hypothetical protein